MMYVICYMLAMFLNSPHVLYRHACQASWCILPHLLAASVPEVDWAAAAHGDLPTMVNMPPQQQPSQHTGAAAAQELQGSEQQESAEIDTPCGNVVRPPAAVRRVKRKATANLAGLNPAAPMQRPYAAVADVTSLAGSPANAPLEDAVLDTLKQLCGNLDLQYAAADTIDLDCCRDSRVAAVLKAVLSHRGQLAVNTMAAGQVSLAGFTLRRTLVSSRATQLS